MASSRCPGPEGISTLPVCPAKTPGPLGINDQADPNRIAFAGDTPGPLGLNDHAEPPSFLGGDSLEDEAGGGCRMAPHDPGADWEQLASGAVPVGTGVGAVTRIPVPGTEGLHIELSPRGRVPASGSTSTLFIQDSAGKRQLRLDYGYNKATGRVEYHWNQKGTYSKLGIPDHAVAGRGGQTLYQAAKYFRYGGRVLLVVGAAVDAYSIVVAKKRLRQVAKVAAGWAGAWAGCKVGGAAGAAVGTALEPGGGTAVVGLGGCIVGGIGGYLGASWAAGKAYDWIEETFFEPVPECGAPHD